MEALIKLHYNLFIPVWIAFLDSHAFNGNAAKPAMHHICASQLDELWEGMKSHLSESEAQAIGVIRLPIALFQKIQDKLEFQIGVRKSRRNW